MILIETVNAYVAILALMNKETDYKTAHALLMLKQRLSPHVEFFSAEEKKLVERFGQKDGEGNVILSGNRLVFAKDADPKEYEQKRLELSGVEVPWIFAKVKIAPPSEIRPIHIEALLPFIEFEEVDG